MQRIKQALGIGQPAAAEEEIEEKIAEGEVFDTAIAQLEARDIPAAQSDEFNINDIVQFFADHTRKELLDDGTSLEEFNQLVNNVISEALRARSPELVQGLLSTLGQAGQQIGTAQNLSPSEIIENAIELAFPLDRFPQLEGRILQPVNVGLLIEELFGTDLQRLQTRNLSQDEIQSIRRQFDNDLDDLEEEIAATTELELEAREAGEAFAAIPRPDAEIFLFGQNTLRKLQEYLNTHVENNQLRQLLLNDVNVLIANNRQKLGIQIGTAPATIVPISATQLQVLRDPIKNALVTTLVPEVERIQAALLEAVEAAEDVPEVDEALQTAATNVVRRFNTFIEKNNIRDRADGQLITIPTETRQEVEAAPLPFVAAPLPEAVGEAPPDIPVIAPVAPQFRIQPVPTAELIALLMERLDQLSSPVQSFEYSPTTIRDPATGETRERVVEDIILMDREANKVARTRMRAKKTLESSISRRAGLKSILTMRAKRRVQLTTMKSGVQIKSHGANMREIRILKDATLGELAKIANMIAMENGSLETISEVPLLDIVKGVTPIQDIVNAIMKIQKMNAGNDFSILFVPANVFGGMFLDGPMDVIQKNRMLVSPVGGNIFSSLFNTVGNVVKTVASVPLQLAGAVFGGGLAPSMVRTDAPQFGGAAHQGADFVRGGEPQPEPFGQVGDNQTFHIQPFPFGGRIDNTGFIDQSQINPKFIWAELPINSLTNFP